MGRWTNLFKVLAEEIGIPYQNRIDFYRRESTHAGRSVIVWSALER